MSAHTRNDSLRAFRNHYGWPQMVLPIKRYTDKGMECAYMINGADHTEGKPQIYHGNVWNPRETDEMQEFESVEALADAGWEVD